MENIIIVLVLAVILGGALLYIYKAKKAGQKCIGCPNAKQCAKGCTCSKKEY